jgi:glucose/arabinose dehydrogenase
MNIFKVTIALLALSSGTNACSSVELVQQLKLIELPPGFEISLYARDVENARQLALGDKGTIFAGSRKAGKVHAIIDSNGDNKADHVYLVDQGLKLPSGVEFKSGSLYVAALDRILRYDNIENQLDQPPEPRVVADSFPDKSHHGWKYLRFGPEGQLYVPVGAPCNICDEPGFAEVRRLSLENNTVEVYAEGLRNTVGLAFHPDTGELWLSDNGRDMLGDDLPADELNHAPRAGMHFGYPWCHQGD